MCQQTLYQNTAVIFKIYSTLEKINVVKRSFKYLILLYD